MGTSVTGRLREWLLRLLATFRRNPSDGDLREELRLHLELAEAEFRRRGHTVEESARLARLRHGQPDNALEQIRRQREIPWFGAFTLDVRLGLRMLRKHLGLTLIGGLAISLGVGIVTCVFMFLDITIWNRSVPLEDGDAVVAIQLWDAENVRRSETRIADFERWRDELGSLEHVGAFRTAEHDLIGPTGEIETIPIAEMSAAGFRVARVAPLLGRTLLPEDEQSGAAPVIVIGYDEWQRRFDGERDILGQTVRLGDDFRTIVGVMPEDFGFPINHQFWIPLDLASIELLPPPYFGAVFARLADGVAIETAQAELSAVGLLPAEPPTERTEPIRLTVVPYAANFVSDVDPDDLVAQAWNARLIILLVSFLLVPLCVNIAMLVYARTVTRQEEIAIRTALGASRMRIVLQLFIEMLVLTTLATIVALAGVRLIAEIVKAMMVQSLVRLPFWMEIGLTTDMLLFAAGLAVAIAVIIGLLPGIKTTARFVRPGLSALDQRNRTRLGGVWTALVVLQVAFSFAAMPTAVELAWGVIRPHVLGPGFAADEYLTATLSMDADAAESENVDASHARFDAARAALIGQLESDRRVLSQVATSASPAGWGTWRRFEIEGGSGASSARESWVDVGAPQARSNTVDRAFLGVLEIPILAGRGFEPGEFAGASQSIIVTETLARLVFGDVSPLGRRIRYLLPQASSDSDSAAWYEIVGIAADRPTHPHAGSILHPADDTAGYPLTITFRAGPDGASLRARLPEMANDPVLEIGAVQSLGEIYDDAAVGNWIGAFAVIASSLSVLLLAAAGTNALMSFTVNQRRREIGIRLALGAPSRGLLAGIFRRALRQLSVGALIGLILALLIQGAMPADRFGGWEVPGVLPLAVALMILTGLIATFGPAQRALGVDPTEALRDAG